LLGAPLDERFMLDMNARPKADAHGKCRRIFVVDQYPLMRSAVSTWLNRFSDLAVCGEAGTEGQALKEVKRLKPDLVLTEVMRQHDLGFIRQLRRRHPLLPILVFSFRDEAWYASKALEAGVHGYLMKGVSGARLVEGIRDVLNGRVVLSSEMKARLRPNRFGRYPRRKWSRILAT